MRHVILALALCSFPVMTAAQNNGAEVAIVNDHILSRVEALAQTSNALSHAALEDCSANSVPLRAAYAQAFDAWVSASHLRFGPTEVGDRAFALAFWPDSRGAIPKALRALIAQEDPVAHSAQDYAEVSIAARGFYALEFLLYGAEISTIGSADYRCALVQTIAADAAETARAISDDWANEYAARLLHPSPEGTYRSEDEVFQELLKALSTGLEFTAETRLGRPMGTFDKPRPTRAEAWRSGRSARHVALSLQSLRELADALADGDAKLVAELNNGFDKALDQLANLDDAVFAGVAQPQQRLKVEVIQRSVNVIRATVRDKLGPKLGVAAGFNSLDGD